MNPSNEKPSLATSDSSDSSLPPSSSSSDQKLIFELNHQQWDDLEDLFFDYPRPTSAHIHGFLQDRPSLSSLDPSFLTDWFSARRSKQRREEHLASLIHTNVKLQAEQRALLLRNRELRKQATLLTIENLRLKEQLVMQMPRTHPSSYASSSSLIEEVCCSSSHHNSDNQESTPACGINIGFDELDLGWSSDDDSYSSS